MNNKLKTIGIMIAWIPICQVAVGQSVHSENAQHRENVQQRENAQQWYKDGQAAVERAKKLTPILSHANNIILFIGDGMDITTVTAARIFEGQQRGEPGEENYLSFEKLPYTALIKTYNVDYQVPDSAGTMTAIITGVKTNMGLLSVNQKVKRGQHQSVKGNRLTTLFELAEQSGLSTGIVSTANVTHATPGACYAHSPERNWESDANLSEAARNDGFPDIARQLIEFSYGDGLELVLGGGRKFFLPNSKVDPEYNTLKGMRLDGRDLAQDWLKLPRSAYVWNKKQFNEIDVQRTDHLLGLFEPGYMKYEHDRAKDTAGEPSLSMMTSKAIDFLSSKKKGYVLVVEGGRIDHAHHGNNAYRALTETIEFARSVDVAIRKTNRRDTLIIVTADHGHMFTMGGYARRGNPILGIVARPGTNHDGIPYLDSMGKPYTTLMYGMGPGYTGPSSAQPEGPKRFPHYARDYQNATDGRADLTHVDTQDPDYLFESAIPNVDSHHGGADVALYADGPMAHLFHGVLEQNVIFHVMVEALGLKPDVARP